MVILSNEFKIACDIYSANILNEPIWYSKIVDRLKNEMEENDVSAAMDALSDFNIVTGKYGQTGNDSVAMLYEITDDHKKRISELCKYR